MSREFTAYGLIDTIVKSPQPLSKQIMCDPAKRQKCDEAGRCLYDPTPMTSGVASYRACKKLVVKVSKARVL